MGSSQACGKGWRGGSAAYSQALVVVCGPDEGGEDCRTKYMAVVAGHMMRRGDRSSVVLGKGLSTRDGKVVKVSAKKNTCIRTDQKSCEKSCEGTEMARASPPRCFSATFFFTRFMTMLLISKRTSDRKFS